MSRATVRKPTDDIDRALVRVSHGERVVLKQGRKAVATVVPMEDLERLRQLENEEDLKDARAALREARRKGTTSWEKAKAELGLK
jgi:antitoxin (DNA-binding transcriptional repressor) of toxin-antitoxin stability system